MLFLELLQISLRVRQTLSFAPSEKDWVEAYQLAVKHALVGLVFSAIEQLNDINNLKPPMPLFYQWLGEVLEIENRNKVLNDATKRLTQIFIGSGRRCCVLKGQRLATLYLNSLRRQSGDVDLWVEGKREETLAFLREKGYKIGEVVIHHVDACIIEGVEIEIHFIPVYTYNPILNRNYQMFFKQQSDLQFQNYDAKVGFCYPKASFNVVYILSHIYMHFLYEGVGLRQIVDYYYVLKSLPKEEREKTRKSIYDVGLRRFAGAVMYVLRQVCCVSSDMMLFEADEKRGKLLLEEICKGGNFGHYDERYKNRNYNNLILYYLPSLKRHFKFVKYYPLDILCVPFWKIWHFCWRKCNGYINKTTI